jgi:hypothetical protein
MLRTNMWDTAVINMLCAWNFTVCSISPLHTVPRRWLAFNLQQCYDLILLCYFRFNIFGSCSLYPILESRSKNGSSTLESQFEYASVVSSIWEVLVMRNLLWEIVFTFMFIRPHISTRTFWYRSYIVKLTPFHLSSYHRYKLVISTFCC